MADIQLRFNKDMLVLSTPFSVSLRAFGYEESDRDYAIICESEVVAESFKFEAMAHAPVFVLPTETITTARLMHSRFENQAALMAQNCFEAAEGFKPQHVLASIAPTGLPLDESSKTSMRQSFMQYQSAVRTLAEYPIDGILFGGFSNAFDAQCALMGARSLYDGPLFITFKIDAAKILQSGSHSLEEAAAIAVDSGADVLGVVSGLSVEELCSAADILSVAGRPMLFEIEVAHVDKRQAFASADNPYPRPDLMADAALELRKHGVQFLRAGGNASPAFTGSLAALLGGLNTCPAKGWC